MNDHLEEIQMTAQPLRPDTRRAKPLARGASRRTAMGPSPAAQQIRDSLRAGLREMTHERLEEARTHLEAASSPEYLAAGNVMAIDALAYLSSVLWQLGDIEGARNASERALELAPGRFAPNQKAGEVAVRLGNLEEAAERFLAALRASEPGTGDAKAAEASLRETRKRASKGIRHAASFPIRPGGLLSRLTAARRNRPPVTPATAGVPPQP